MTFVKTHVSFEISKYPKMDGYLPKHKTQKEENSINLH